MSSPLQREALLDIVERCGWLIEYYGRSGVAPKSVDVLTSTMKRAMDDLEALSPVGGSQHWLEARRADSGSVN